MLVEYIRDKEVIHHATASRADPQRTRRTITTDFCELTTTWPAIRVESLFLLALGKPCEL
jgi:hypothetical protein